jgi:hypothetical protein
MGTGDEFFAVDRRWERADETLQAWCATIVAVRGRRLLDEPPRPGTTVRDQYRTLRLRSRTAAYVAVTGAILLVGIVAVALWHQGQYGVWPATNGTPYRLDYCDRWYTDQGSTTLTAGEPLEFAFTFSPPLAAHHDVYSRLPLASPPATCTMELLMKTGTRYEVYDIEGGP